MATTKTYNEVDCKEKLLYIEIEKGEYGGYRQHLLADNLNEVAIDFYICDKCNGLLRNACIVGVDQNLACEMCVLEGETSLPMIKSRKKIPEIGAKCPLVSRGCVWRGNIGEVDAHLNECTELIVNCPDKCKFILKRSELINHRENGCRNRKVNCMHCKAVLLYKELDNHLNICPELPLLCLNECMETFPRKEMNSHIENNCPNTIISCPNSCGVKMKRRDLSIHFENECQHQIVSCEYCGGTMLHKELGNHHKVCLEFPIICPNECLESLIRKELESHIGKGCPNALIACPYKDMGCNILTKRCEVQQHDKIFESYHFEITVIYYSDKVKSMETLAKDNDIIVTELTGKVSDMRIQLQNNQKEFEVLTSIITNLEAQMKEKDRENKRLNEEVGNLRDQLLIQEIFEELPEAERISINKYQFIESGDIESIHHPSKTEPNVNKSLGALGIKTKLDSEGKKIEKISKSEESEILPIMKNEHLKVGFLNRYVAGYLWTGWWRSLVAMEDGAYHIYNAAKDYGKKSACILDMKMCDAVYKYRECTNKNKPAVPPEYSSHNGFVIKVSGKLNYFLADTLKDAMQWMELLENIRKRPSQVTEEMIPIKSISK